MSIKEIVRNWFFKDCSVMIGSSKSFDSSEYMANITEQAAFMLPITKKINACKNITMAVYKQEKEGKKIVEKHTLNGLFNMINPNTSFQDFLDYLIVWMESSDNGVLLEVIKGIPSLKPDLYIHSPKNFTIYFEGRRIREIRIHNPAMSITGDELKNYMWIRSPNYENIMDSVNSSGIGRGYSKHNATSIFGAYSWRAWLWNWNLAKNLGKPGGILQTEGAVDKEDREEIRAKYSAHYAGSENAGSPLVIGSGLKYQDTSRAPIDADWSVAEQKAHERAALAVDVPAELVGGGESTYQNRKQAKKELYREAVIPFFNNLKNWLNYLLADYLKAGEFIDYDITGADELKEDIGEVITKLEPLKNRVTVNEYRRIISSLTDLSLGDLADGDVILVSGGDVPLDEVIAEDTSQAEREGDIE
ncbi:phage portal protein [Fusobacterium gastrosuis]|uniref:phage portal protein n=1 Tax=Fusobacterium gastrosuis TaxID=1755100 RepID=UPI002975F9DE|nr:phage portal protein [Fusobacteriaceae bacterium]MDY5712355.1 phage portal protein [Fusobacterium gastrosuis]